MLARVGKLLVAVVIFLLAFYPVQVIILLVFGKSFLPPSPGFWITTASFLLSVLCPLLWLYFSVRKVSDAPRDRMQVLLYCLMASVGLVIVVILAIEVTMVPFYMTLPISFLDFNARLRARGLLEALAFLVSLAIPLMFPYGVANVLRPRLSEHPERGEGLQATLRFIMPLYIAGAISLPLYALAHLVLRPYGLP